MGRRARRRRSPFDRRGRIWKIVLGVVFFILGVIGILVPVMPQVLFFALSLFFFSQVFPGVRRWVWRSLRKYPRIWNAYRRWREKGRRKRQELIRREKELAGEVKSRVRA
jgi:uncharacterized membrane protein YbaN (DUF454 family)